MRMPAWLLVFSSTLAIAELDPALRASGRHGQIGRQWLASREALEA